MNVNLQFDFLVDKANNTITVKREFAAKRPIVWDCHTKSELLDKWFAPKPMTTKTKSMDFSEGGHWHYAMIDPEGNEYWGYMEYVSITPIDSYTTRDNFCDETGKVNSELPGADWIVTFKDKSMHTLVETVVTYATLEGLEKVLQMGMKEGLTSTLERLDELLLDLEK